LYLPKDWADDPVRRTVAGVPDDIRFKTKPEIALQQMRQALTAGVPRPSCWLIRRMATTAIFALGSPSLACLTCSVLYPVRSLAARRDASVADASFGPRPASKRLRRNETHPPVSVKTLAVELPAEAWQPIAWRDAATRR
jgi:SRSO17 transposase